MIPDFKYAAKETHNKHKLSSSNKHKLSSCYIYILIHYMNSTITAGKLWFSKESLSTIVFYLRIESVGGYPTLKGSKAEL